MCSHARAQRALDEFCTTSWPRRCRAQHRDWLATFAASRLYPPRPAGAPAPGPCSKRSPLTDVGFFAPALFARDGGPASVHYCAPAFSVEDVASAADSRLPCWSPTQRESAEAGADEDEIAAESAQAGALTLSSPGIPPLATIRDPTRKGGKKRSAQATGVPALATAQGRDYKVSYAFQITAMPGRRPMHMVTRACAPLLLVQPGAWLVSAKRDPRRRVGLATAMAAAVRVGPAASLRAVAPAP